MTKEEFADGVREFRRSCDLSDLPRNEVMAVWYRNLERIEAKEWKSIVKRMVRTADGFPRNFVQAVSAYIEPKTPLPPTFSDIEIGAEDEEAALACFESLRRVGTWPREREEVGV